jgi:Fur family peroxide stress response transcriptional regulator
MHIKISKDLIKFFTDKCRQHNLKVTPQRMAIYTELIKSKNHPSAELIFQRIRKQFPNISFDTVNRTLFTFSEIGLVDVVEGLGRPRRFDSDMSMHHHFHCIKCGNIIDFNSDAYNSLEIPEDIERKYTVIRKRVVLKGICDKCRKKASF